MGEKRGIQWGAIWGCGFIAIALFFLASWGVLKEGNFGPAIKQSFLILMMLLFVSTFAGHIVGYIHLAKELQMNLLLRLSRTALMALCAFGLLVIPWIIIDSSTNASRLIFSTFAIALLVVVLSLGTGIATLYSRFGFLAILSFQPCPREKSGFLRERALFQTSRAWSG